MTLLVSSLLENHYSIICFLFFSFFGQKEKREYGKMELQFDFSKSNQKSKFLFKRSHEYRIQVYLGF